MKKRVVFAVRSINKKKQNFFFVALLAQVECDIYVYIGAIPVKQNYIDSQYM